MRVALYGFMIASSLFAPVQAQVLSAADLLVACTRVDMQWIAFCNGFFQAVHDVGAASGGVCAQGATRTDLVRAFEQGAADAISSNPDIGAMPGLDVVRAVITRAFPCG